MRFLRPVLALTILAAGLAGGVLLWSRTSTARTATDVAVQRGQQVYARFPHKACGLGRVGGS